MTLRTHIARSVARLVTSERRSKFLRTMRDGQRRLLRQPAIVHYFHQAEDPYSLLAASQLAALPARYRVLLRRHEVPPPDRAAAPQAEALREWSRRDALRWASHFGIDTAVLSSTIRTEPDDTAASAAILERGRQLRAKLGHYQSAMFYFEGEWYWGLDRLHYLESRLIAAGLALDVARASPAPLFPPPDLQWREVPVIDDSKARPRSPPTLHFYCSLRSPYTWLAIERVVKLARHYGAKLELDYVLPMVMRGLPVPWNKRRYILQDSKREAVRLGLPFGDIVDPVGEPTERGLALLQRAIELDRGEALLESFLRGVFAEGIDAGSAQGLAEIAARAQLSSAEVASALRNPHWREIAEKNRTELFAGGLWGVPSFRVDGFPAIWGQDRLWMVEQDLIAALHGQGNAIHIRAENR